MYTNEIIHEIYEITKRNDTLPQFVIDGKDYHKLILECNSFNEVLKYKDKIDIKQCINIYLSNKETIIKEDREIIETLGGDDEINNKIEHNEITAELAFYRENIEKYEKFMKKVENIHDLPYEIKESVYIKHYKMLDKNGNDLNISKMLELFNLMETSQNIQIIVFTPSDGKKVYKVSTKYPINSMNKLLNMNFKENTISLVYESYKSDTKKDLKKAVLNFETGNCEIEIKGGKNDITLINIKKIFEKYINLEELQDMNTIVGELEITSVKKLDYFSFYEFMVTDNIASKLFYVDERVTPWCVTKKHIKFQFFDPLVILLDPYLKGIYQFSYVKVHSSTSIPYCSVKFSSRNLKHSELTAKIFSKMVRLYNKTEKTIVNVDYEKFFFSTSSKEIKHRTGMLTKTERLSSSDGYTSKCEAKYQPIFISEEEIEEYEKFQKEIGTLTSDDGTYYFTCMNEEFPNVKYFPINIVSVSGADFFGCCSSSKSSKKASKVGDSGKIATTSSIKTFGHYSESPTSVLSNFIKLSFDEYDNCEVGLQGTGLEISNSVRINNSFICAMLLSQEVIQYDVTNSNSKNILAHCIDVRRRMLELPFEIFAQELYDTSIDEFTKNMLDIDHYIDPYLYYRGLEEIFNVNIICFTSKIKKRQFPSSYEEKHEDNPTIEIPRCTQYHTRRFNKDRNTVLLFKNFGSERKKMEIPSCELIYVNVDGNKINYFNTSNVFFFDFITDHFNKCCTPFIIDGKNQDVKIYSAIQDWDPNELGFGKVIGQELDIYGKAKLLIYKEWNVVFNPSIQPLAIRVKTNPHNTKVNKDGKISEYRINKKETKRATLKSIDECLEIFKNNVIEVSDDGIIIQFNGVKDGLKILCENEKYRAINYEVVTDMIKNKNNISALLQMINWLWRSEIDYISFKKWIKDKIRLKETIDVKLPDVSLNNMYLPKFDSYEERINFCETIWNTFFKRGKINLTESLRDRIVNLMNFQDKYVHILTEDDPYNEVPKFITGLIPQEEDYTRYENMIFTKEEHFRHWYNFTNRSNESHVSLNNMNVVNSKIYEEMSYKINPYFYITDYGKIFLIQNVHTSTNKLNCAIQLAKHWKDVRENLGPYISNNQVEKQISRYVQFKLSEDNIPKPLNDKSHNSDDFLCILSYKDGYAAMLPIN